MAGSPLARLRVLGREGDRVPREVEVFELDADELADPAAELVDNPDHEFVAVVLDPVEKPVPLVNRQITYGLAKTRVLRRFRSGFHI